MRGLPGRWESRKFPLESQEFLGVYKERMGEGKDLNLRGVEKASFWCLLLPISSIL